MTGAVITNEDAFEKAANEVRLSSETKDIFRREFSAEELLWLSKHLKEVEKEYNREKVLPTFAVLAYISVLLIAFAVFAKNIQDYIPVFRVPPMLFGVLFSLILVLVLLPIVLPIAFISRKRETNENNIPLTGERKLRHWAKIAIETGDIERSNNIARFFKIFK